MKAGEYSDRAIVDWIERHPNSAPHFGMNGMWVVTAHGNRECWGKAKTFRECMYQVLDGSGPDAPDR